MTEPNDLAFPQVKTDTTDNPPYVYSEGGLSKREYFAAQALVGLSMQLEYTNVNDIAATCVQYADALIAALNKEKPQEGTCQK